MPTNISSYYTKKTDWIWGVVYPGPEGISYFNRLKISQTGCKISMAVQTGIVPRTQLL
jgi:hypothetical protein